MNPQEQNGILDNLNFLHSDHDTYFEYNQEKLGSEIHASVSCDFLFWAMENNSTVRIKGV